ncbi:extensin family protein [Pectobacterium colocasium]
MLLRRKESLFFNNSLGTEYNAAHANHLHFAMRRFECVSMRKLR